MKPTRPAATRSTMRRRRSNATGSNAGRSTIAHGRAPRSAWIGGRPACHGGTANGGLDGPDRGCAPVTGLGDAVGSFDAPEAGCEPVTGANGTLGVACEPDTRGGGRLG